MPIGLGTAFISYDKMHRTLFKNSIAVFLWMVFISIKVINIHAYEHIFKNEKANIPCKTCDFIVSANKSVPLFLSDSGVPEIPVPRPKIYLPIYAFREGHIPIFPSFNFLNKASPRA